MFEADSLNREVAFLSNKLHTFADDDITGVRPVIDKIESIRTTWKEVRKKILYVEKFGKLPEVMIKPKPDQSEANVKYEKGLVQGAIRKLRHRLKNKPDSPAAPGWAVKLESLLMEEKKIQHTLIALK